MRPFFPFYGSKWLLARHYGEPQARVLEPFCGSAGYATYYEPASVRLNDLDPIIAGVWAYLIGATAAEILALPDLEPGQSTDDLSLPQEARWLIGFWLNRGSATPKKTQTAFSRRTERSQLIWGERARQRIAGQLHLISHWKITCQSWEHILELAEHGTTTFVDPPYTEKGRHYRYSVVDYPLLSERMVWLPGHLICCEQEGADWYPFEPLRDIKATRGRSLEVVHERQPAQLWSHV